MASENINSTKSRFDALDPQLLNTHGGKVDDNPAEVNKDEFLQLLVTQLQNQDPLDPMQNEEFAVQLAQFSSLEQLVNINNNLEGASGIESFGSLVSYLGHEVTLSTSDISVSEGDGGSVKVNLAADAANVSLDILNSEGAVVSQVNLGAMSAGKHSVDLKDLPVNDGEYSLAINAVNTGGFNLSASVNKSGVVSGFVPGPDPELLVEGKSVALTDIISVEIVEGGPTGSSETVEDKQV
ncbi:MAG: hypothetical protein KDD53_05475 [Bdellovibrionales bacterium]|nr:hypothetical protein [Bdellovibrionales bacterium]